MHRSISSSFFTAILFVWFALFGATTSAFQRPTLVTNHRVIQVGTSSQLYDGPAVLDRPETIEEVDIDKDTQRENKLGGEGWEIRLFNDPFNKREFVARCLATICGKSDTESYQIMMEAHKNGMGVVGRYQFEIAELYYNSLRENGLFVDMIPVDDE
mmetsp:Transcript_43104/g.85557  ORF Transcript_43104/g.85557 Transcript_43104/m.85557 type:complete len:157 (+) Transcript_43104:121-591(+)